MTFLEIVNASFGLWAPVLRVIYLTNLTGQTRYMTELKWIWLVIVSGDSPEIISLPGLGSFHTRSETHATLAPDYIRFVITHAPLSPDCLGL